MSITSTAEIVDPWSHSLVTGIPEIGILQVDNQDGSQQLPPIELSRKEAAAHLDEISAMYLSAGPGEHSLRYVGRHAEMLGLTVAPKVIRLSSIMPEDVVHYGLSGDGREVVRFGKIAIAGRKPTLDELLIHSERVSQTTRPTAESKRAETLTLDPYKIDLTGFDNASIRVGERLLHLQIDSPLTLLAVRVLGRISHMNSEDRALWLDADALARNIWDCMPLTERSVFVDEKNLFGLGVGMGKRVDDILNTLTSILGITRRGPGGRKYKVVSSDLALRYGQTPHEGAFPEGVSSLYPPGTNPDMVLGEIPEPKLVAAQAIMPFSQLNAISQPQALQVLDTILNRDGKRALSSLVGGNEVALSRVVEKLDRLARRSLGAGYYTARISRTNMSKRVGYGNMGTPKTGAAAGIPKWRIVSPA